MRRLHTALGLGALATAAVLAPAGCLFPDFTFNDNGSGGSTTSVGGGGSGGITTSSSTVGGGGTGGHTTSTTTVGGGGTGGSTTTTTGGGGTGGTTTSTTTTGGGGTGGSTTTTTTTTTTTSSSTGNPVENCQNGIDDDGDGLIDCKDLTDCADYSCLPAVPATWTGYFLLYDGPVADDPSCIEQFPTSDYTGNANLNAPAATCSSCMCSNPMNQICDPPDEIDGLDVNCGGSPTEVHPLTMPFGWGPGCTTAQDPMIGGYYFPGGLMTCGADNLQPCHLAITAQDPTVTGGFCNPSGGTPTIIPAKWDGFGHACGGAITTGKGCAIGQTCMPKPQSPYVSGLCIKKAGSQMSCPAQFPNMHKFFDDFTDSRSCSQCGCDAPNGGTCAGNLTTYGDTVQNQCLSPVVTFAAGTCANLSGNPAIGNSKFTVTTPPSGGSCMPNGGQPIGTAAATFPTTFCCAN